MAKEDQEPQSEEEATKELLGAAMAVEPPISPVTTEEFGGVTPDIAEYEGPEIPETTVAPVTGDELSEYYQLKTVLFEGKVSEVRENNRGITEQEAKDFVGKEFEKYDFLPPARAPVPPTGSMSRVLGRRTISHQDPDKSPQENLVHERNKAYAEIEDLGMRDQLGAVWRGPVIPISDEDATAAGLFLEDDPRATDEELAWAAKVGGMTGAGLSAAHLLWAAKRSGISPSQLVRKHPVATALGVGMRGLMGAAIGMGSTGIIKGFEDDEFWKGEPLWGEEDVFGGTGWFPKGAKDLGMRTGVKARIWDAQNWLSGMMDPEWSEQDQQRASNLFELSDPGANIAALRDINVAMLAAEEGSEAKEAYEQHFTNGVLGLARLDIPRQVLDDSRTFQERKIRAAFPEASDSWVRRHLDRATQITPLKLRRLLNRDPSLRNRVGIALPALRRAVDAHDAGADEGTIQDRLNAVPLREFIALSQAPTAGGDIMDHVIEHEGKTLVLKVQEGMIHWEALEKALAKSKELLDATGGASTAVAERAWSEMMLTRVENDDGHPVLVESTFSRTMRLMMGLQELFLEAPIPYITPAGIDFAYGLGIRSANSTYIDRVLASMASGAGGLTWNQMTLAHRLGWDRRSWKYAITQNLAVLFDFIFPWEEMAVAVPFSAAKSAYRFGTIPHKITPSGAPLKAKLQVAAAVTSPSAYRLYHQLVHGKDAAPLGDTLSTTSHAFHSMIREATIAGDIHKTPIPKLIESQAEIISGKLGVEGGYMGLRDAVMKLSEDNFGTMLSSVEYLLEHADAITTGMRSTEGYRSMVADLRKLVDEGIIKRDELPLYVALLEIQGIRFTQDPGLPSIQSPEDFFNRIRHAVGGTGDPDLPDSGIHPGVRDLGADALGNIHAEEPSPVVRERNIGKSAVRALGAIKRGAKDFVSFLVKMPALGHFVNWQSIDDLAGRIGVDVDSKSFAGQLVEMGFVDAEGVAELPIDDAGLSRIYEAMQRGVFGGDTSKLSPESGKTFIDRDIPEGWTPRRLEMDGEIYQVIEREDGTIVSGTTDEWQAIIDAQEAASVERPREVFRHPIDYDVAQAGPIRADMSIEEVEKAGVGSKIEHGAWFDGEDMRQVGRRAGVSSWVPFYVRDYVRSIIHGNLIFTHFHPIGGPLSPSDILGAIFGNLGEARAISGIDGTTYSIRRPEGGWGEQFDWSAEVADEGASAITRMVRSDGYTGLRKFFDKSYKEDSISAVRKMAVHITEVTGDPERGKRFINVGIDWVNRVYGEDAKLSDVIRSATKGEDAYDAEIFGRFLEEEWFATVDQAFHELGIETRIERLEGGQPVQARRGSDVPLAAISRSIWDTIRGIEEAKEPAPGAEAQKPTPVSGRIIKREDIEHAGPRDPQQEMFGKVPVEKVEELPAEAAPKTEAEVQSEEIADVVDRTGKLGMDKAQMVAILGATMYDSDIFNVIVKELVQNSWDAVKGAEFNGEIAPGDGKIDVIYDIQNRTIEVTDNGSGMTGETVDKAFFTIAGTEKGGLPEAMRSGGLGMAKMAYLFSGESIELVTVKNGVKTSTSATPESIMGETFTIREEPTTDPNGTTVIVKLPESVMDFRTGTSRDIHFRGNGSTFLKKPLIGDVEVRQLYKDPKAFPDPNDPDPWVYNDTWNPAIGKNFDYDATPLWNRATFDWGSADIYVGVEKSNYPDIRVLSSGLYQFDLDTYTAPWRGVKKALPHDIIIDIKPDVKTDHPSYPFNNQREGFRGTIDEDVAALGAFLLNVGRSREAETTASVFGNVISMERFDIEDVVDVEGMAAEAARARKWTRAIEAEAEGEEPAAAHIPDIEIIDGEIWIDGKKRMGRKEVERANEYKARASFKAEKEVKSASAFFDTKTVDPSKPLFHNNTNLEIPDSAKPMLAKIGSVVVAFRERLGALYGYEDLHTEGIIYATGISLDKSYEGIHVKVPYRAFFLNPLINIGKNANGVAGAWWHTFVHEAAHFKRSGHDANFAREMANLSAKLADSGDEIIIRTALDSILEQHWDDYVELRRQFERSTTQNLAEPLEGEHLPTEEELRVRRGVPAVGRADGGEEGLPGRRLPGGPERGPEPEPGAVGPSAREVIHSRLVGDRGVEAPEAPEPERIGLAYMERAHDGGYRTIHADPAKLDADWSKDPDYYVPREGRSKQSESKYNRFAEFLQSGRPIEIPRVSIGPDTTKPVAFSDGRHRFAVLRDMGEQSIPVQVPSEQAMDFVAAYGIDPEVMKPTVESRGPSRLLAGVTGARGELPEFALRQKRYKKLRSDLATLDEEVRKKQAGRYTDTQLEARESIQAELDSVLNQAYEVFKPDLNRVLTEDAHPDDIKMSAVHPPDLDQGGLAGWGGEIGHPIVHLELAGDRVVAEGRLAQFSKAYEQESLVIRETIGSTPVPDEYLQDVSRNLPEATIESMGLVYGQEGTGARAATLRVELNERILARPQMSNLLRVVELSNAGISVIRTAEVIDFVYTPELARQPISPTEFVQVARNIAHSLAVFAESRNLGDIGVGLIRENIYVSGPEAGTTAGGYRVKSYDEVIGEGLNAEAANKSARAGVDSGPEQRARNLNAEQAETTDRSESEQFTPGRGDSVGHLPDPSPASQAEVARELTPELGRHLDREGGVPHEAVAKSISERLEQSGLSSDAIDEARKRLKAGQASPLRAASQKVDIELSLPDDPGGKPRTLSFDVRLVRTDMSPAFVPGGIDGEFSYADLDYLARRPILLDPRLNLDGVQELPGKEISRLRRTYKSVGIPEQVINDVLGLSLPEERLYSAADSAAVLRAASDAYEDLTVALYKKQASSMGSSKYRPDAPDVGETPSQGYLDRLGVHAMDQLSNLILGMTSAGTNITENQLLTAAIRPRNRDQLRNTAKLIRDGRQRKRAHYEERQRKISEIQKKVDAGEASSEDLVALSDAYFEIGLPRDAVDQIVGGKRVYSDKQIDSMLKESGRIYDDLTREEAQYLLGIAITAGSKLDAKFITKGILGEIRGGGFRKWWEPGTPFQLWEWDSIRDLNETSYKEARDAVLGKMDRIEIEIDVLRQDLDADKSLLKAEKGKLRKASVRKRIKQNEASIERRENEITKLRGFLRSTASDFIPSSPTPRLTDGYVSRSKSDPRLIADLIAAFDEDLARVESGKQQYLWFERHPDETFDEFIVRIQSSAKGLGTKTSSLALALTDPANADAAAIDVHMIRKLWRQIVPDASNRVRDWYNLWQQGRGVTDPPAGLGRKALIARQDVDFDSYRKDYSSDWVARIQGMLTPRPIKTIPSGTKLDPAASRRSLKRARVALRAARVAGATAVEMEKLGKAVEQAEALVGIQTSVKRWEKMYPDHPLLAKIKDGNARVTTDAYSRAVNAIRKDPVAKDEALSTFGVQWMRWDQIRRYFEPHMTVAPGASSIPGMNPAALLELRKELAELHFFRQAGKSTLDPGVRLYSHDPAAGPRIMFSGTPEAPRGSFEIDASTGKMLITMFRTGNLDVLFHENGHMLMMLLGRQWRDELFQHFPTKIYPELIEQDLKAGGGFWDSGKRVTPEGMEQLAESWRWYLKTRVGPGGPVRRKFTELYRTLQDFWLRIRNQEEVLPGRMVDLFDAYFRPVDAAREGAIGLVAAAKSKRFPRVFIDAERGRAWQEGKVQQAQQKMGWEAVDVTEEHLRQALDIPETQTDIDAVELFSKIYAYVATEQVRKMAGPMGLQNLTLRTHVPTNRVKEVQKRVADRRIYYGQPVAELPDISTRSAEVEGAKDLDVVEVVELDDAQAAGFKRMVEDLSGEPMGNIIPSKMLEDGYDFSRPTVNEYNTTIDVLIDVSAGVGARQTGYSNKISPSMGYALWGVFKSAANNLSDDKAIAPIRFVRDMARTYFDLAEQVDDLNPIPRTIVESGARRISDAPNWARRLARTIARESKTDPNVENYRINSTIIEGLHETLDWPVHPGKVWNEKAKGSALLDMRDKFENLRRVEDNRRVRWDKENPDRFPNADEYSEYTTEELFSDLDAIKTLLREEGADLSHEAAWAIDRLEVFKQKLRDQSIESLNEDEQFMLGEAIYEIHNAIRRKVETVVSRADVFLDSIAGSERSGLRGATDIRDKMRVYSWFFDGKFDELVDFVHNRGFHTGLESTRMSRLDISEVMLEMIIRLRAMQEEAKLLEDLVRYDLGYDVRNLDKGKKLGSGFDRDAFAARVLHYLKNEVAGDRSIRAKMEDGKQTSVELPRAPDTSMYPVRDRTYGPVDEYNNPHDMSAYFKAIEIRDRFGTGTFIGNYDIYTAPTGEELFLPTVAIEHLKAAVERSSGVGKTYNRSSIGKKFLPERRGLPLMESAIAKDAGGNPIIDPATGKPMRLEKQLERELGVESWSAISKAINFLFYYNPMNMARIKLGITVGFLGENTPPYWSAVGIGAMFQMYQGLGPFRAVMDAFPARQTFATVSRLYKDGRYRPKAPPVIDPLGRIYTMDAVADICLRYGLNTSLVKAETVGAVSDDIARNTPRGALEAAGYGLAEWQNTLIEFTTAIDNYFRTAVLIGELKRGSGPAPGAKLARKVGYDYNALTEEERKVLRDTFLFYSYLRKNQDLFWDTMLTNPSRIINQFRLMRGLHYANMETEDREGEPISLERPGVVLQEHHHGRLPVYFRNVIKDTHAAKKIMYFAPPTPAFDGVGLWVDIFGAAEALTSPMRETGRIRGLVSRVAPWYQAPFVFAFNEDIFYERELGAHDRVPAWFVEADYWGPTGGLIVEDILDITTQPGFDPATEPFPGYGDYYARNGKAYWVFTRLLQTPGFGRSMDTGRRLDRANTGGPELAMEGMRQARKALVRVGLAEYPRPINIPRLPSEAGKPYTDTPFGRIEVPAMEGPRRGLTGLGELPGFFAISPSVIQSEDVMWARYLRGGKYVLKDEIKQMKKGQRED